MTFILRLLLWPDWPGRPMARPHSATQRPLAPRHLLSRAEISALFARELGK